MRIELSLETWVEILDWLKRKEFAAKLDQLWDREFTPIAQDWLHNQRNVQLGMLFIEKGPDGRAELRDKQDEILPIAQVDMPDNIRGFRQIIFGFVDSSVLEFLARMRPLFYNVSLLFLSRLSTVDLMNAAFLLDRLQPLISGPIKFMDVFPELIPILNDYIPTVFFNTKKLYISNMSDNRIAELIVHWLFTPREDGQPRVLILEDDYIPTQVQDLNRTLTIVRQRFVDPERMQPSPFFIRVWVIARTAADELLLEESATEHGPTGEQLTVKKTMRDEEGQFYVLISNCALDDDRKELEEAQILDWDWEAETDSHRQSNFIL